MLRDQVYDGTENASEGRSRSTSLYILQTKCVEITRNCKLRGRRGGDSGSRCAPNVRSPKSFDKGSRRYDMRRNPPKRYEQSLRQSQDGSDFAKLLNCILLHSPLNDSCPKNSLINIDSGLVADDRTNCGSAKDDKEKRLSSISEGSFGDIKFQREKKSYTYNLKRQCIDNKEQNGGIQSSAAVCQNCCCAPVKRIFTRSSEI
ncbi:hypothetical protein AVEN_126400-1 [Araneus ventricosus]|uniref:Uncharacterized protein n=1 Tax=Araneus ventricosus TaxID=182803 RepID=A0A4Y2GES3_ARAVE|nr:hypothetical protein AVEN_126400-1 [Araneus ventricosus]